MYSDVDTKVCEASDQETGETQKTNSEKDLLLPLPTCYHQI